MLGIIRKIFGTPGNPMRDFNVTLQEKSLKKQIHDEKKEKVAEEMKSNNNPPMAELQGKKEETLLDNKSLAAPYSINEMFKKDHPFERRDTSKRRQLTQEEVAQLQNARKAIKDEKKE